MQAVVESDGEWSDALRHRAARSRDTFRARDLMRMIAEAAHFCGDPGMQFDTTINDWHTCPNTGRDQRVEPVQRVHAPRRFGLQSRVAEPDEVPEPTSSSSTSRASATRSTS